MIFDTGLKKTDILLQHSVFYTVQIDGLCHVEGIGYSQNEIIVTGIFEKDLKFW